MRFVAFSSAVGALVAGCVAVPLFFTVGIFADGNGGAGFLYLVAGGIVSALLSGAVAVTAVGFAAVARRVSYRWLRALIIWWGTAAAVSVITVPYSLVTFDATFALSTVILNVVSGLALAGGALAPWRYGFARPEHTLPTDAPRVP